MSGGGLALGKLVMSMTLVGGGVELDEDGLSPPPRLEPASIAYVALLEDGPPFRDTIHLPDAPDLGASPCPSSAISE
jgi:hypothetical protein